MGTHVCPDMTQFAGCPEDAYTFHWAERRRPRDIAGGIKAQPILGRDQQVSDDHGRFVGLPTTSHLLWEFLTPTDQHTNRGRQLMRVHGSKNGWHKPRTRDLVMLHSSCDVVWQRRIRDDGLLSRWQACGYSLTGWQTGWQIPTSGLTSGSRRLSCNPAFRTGLSCHQHCSEIFWFIVNFMDLVGKGLHRMRSNLTYGRCLCAND